jgi:hypothetical protein
MAEKSSVPKGEDWRLQGQERYLAGVELVFRSFDGELRDHDHCEFCWRKFSPREGDLHQGWCTPDGYRWICEECFRDFRERFGWKINE